MKPFLIYAILLLGCGGKAHECTAEAEQLQETVNALVECEEELDQMAETCFDRKANYGDESRNK